MSIFNEINFRNLHGDILGGVTAAVVALPMALAFGVASGAGAEVGLYGAIMVGLFAALFGGSPKNLCSVASLGGLVTRDTSTNATAENTRIATTGFSGGTIANTHAGDVDSGNA